VGGDDLTTRPDHTSGDEATLTAALRERERSGAPVVQLRNDMALVRLALIAAVVAATSVAARSAISDPLKDRRRASLRTDEAAMARESRGCRQDWGRHASRRFADGETPAAT